MFYRGSTKFHLSWRSKAYCVVSKVVSPFPALGTLSASGVRVSANAIEKATYPLRVYYMIWRMRCQSAALYCDYSRLERPLDVRPSHFTLISIPIMTR